MEFYGWHIDFNNQYTPFVNEELKKAIFVQTSDGGYSGHNVQAFLTFNDSGQLVMDANGCRFIMIGEKHLKLEPNY